MTRATAQHGPQDASRLSVPIHMTAAIMFTAVAIGGAFWSVTGSMRNQLDVIGVKIDAAADLARLRDDNAKGQLDAMKDEIKGIKSQQTLLQLQLQSIQIENAAAKGKP